MSEGRDVSEQINRLKKLGVFIKTYNMAHILATRYRIDEDFGIQKSIEQLDKIEVDIKDTTTNLNRKEHEKKEDNKTELINLRFNLGQLRDNYKTSLRTVKTNIGTELYNRFNKGFVRTRDNREENEKIGHSEFLFKKLKF
jgi:hypothetical protein